MKTVTVVYEILDEAEWAKQNPLHYAHDGLKAVRVGLGDALDARDALAELFQYAEEDYYPNCALPAYRDAMEHAKASLSANTQAEGRASRTLPRLVGGTIGEKS